MTALGAVGDRRGRRARRHRRPVRRHRPGAAAVAIASTRSPASSARSAAAIDAATLLPSAVRNDIAGLVRRVQDQVGEHGRQRRVDRRPRRRDRAVRPRPGASRGRHRPASAGRSTSPRGRPARAIFQPTPARAGQSLADAAVEARARGRGAGADEGRVPSRPRSCRARSRRSSCGCIGDDPFIILHFEKIEFLLRAGQEARRQRRVPRGRRHRVRRAAVVRQHAQGDHPVRRVQRPAVPRRHRRRDQGRLRPRPARRSPSACSASPTSRSAPHVPRAVHRRVARRHASTSAPRENPFRLTVWLFGGGGFFGITITPEKCRVLEAAFEFGAAVALDFGVASGSIECMAGVYFRHRGRRRDADRLLPAARRGRRARPDLGVHRAVPRADLRVLVGQGDRPGDADHRGRGLLPVVLGRDQLREEVQGLEQRPDVRRDHGPAAAGRPAAVGRVLLRVRGPSR